MTPAEYSENVVFHRHDCLNGKKKFAEIHRVGT